MLAAGKGQVTTSVDSHVLTVVIDNPTKANTLDVDMLRALHHAWHEHDRNPEVWAALVVAAGDRHFCGGANLALIPDDSGSNDLANDDAIRRYTNRECGFRKPVVVAVTGAVLGAGLGFVVAADIVVASRNASFLDPHVRLAQVTGLTGIPFGRLLPAGEASRSLLAADKISAQRAYEVGLVTELFDTPDEARAGAAALAGRIAQHSPTAVQKNMALLRKLAWGDGDDPLVAEAMAVQQAHFDHPDAQEGLSAFAEKRPGNWVTPETSREAAS